MLRMKSLIAASFGVVLCVAATANGSIQFSQAELLGMKINLVISTGYTAGDGTGILTSTPLYEDGVTPMQGVAGAVGNLKKAGKAYYSLSAADLLTFNSAISSGTETLISLAANDNNQTWDVGIWYRTLAGIVTDFVNLAPGATGGVSLAMPSAVLDAGVFVHSVLGQPDAFHASWNAPEPTTIVVWAGLIGVGAVVRLRRQRNS